MHLLKLGSLIMREGENLGTGLDFSTLISTVTGSVTAAQILTYMGSIIAGGVGIWLAWVFGRKAVSSLLNAIKGRKPRV